MRAYFTERLEDPSLIDRAVVVPGDLAVPVGGKRRGGWVRADSHEDAEVMFALLYNHDDDDGFPDLRMESSDGNALVVWGHGVPYAPLDGDAPLAWAIWEVTCGRVYGYREDKIRAFLIKLYGADVAEEALMVAQR
jgi:hypothetical protein